MSATTILTIAVIVIVFIVLFKVFKLILRLLLVVVFLFLAFITNPVPELHEEAVARRAEREDFDLKNTRIEVDDYYVFSLTYANTGNDRRLIGAAAFTQIIIFRNP